MQDITIKLKIFKALSDENRVKILHQIQKTSALQACQSSDCSPKDVCVTSLATMLGITPASTSHHVKELVNAGLITTSKDGRWVYCHINQRTLSEVSDFLKQLGKEEP